MKEFVRTLRTQALIVALLILIPSAAMGIKQNMDERALLLREAQRHFLEMVRATAAFEEQHLAQIVQSLNVIARVQEISRPDTVPTRDTLIRLTAGSNLFLSLSVVDLDGNYIASTYGLSSPVNVSDRAYFRRMLDTGRTAFGEYLVSRVTGVPSVVIAHPVYDRDGNLIRALVASFPTDWFDDLATTIGLNRSSRSSLHDRVGTIMARHPDPEGLVGTRDEHLMSLIIEHGGKEGVLHDKLPGSPASLIAFSAILCSQDEPILYATISTPVNELYKEANRTALQHTALLFLLLVVLFWMARLLMRRWLIGPVDGLIDLVRKIAAGDLSARTGVSGFPKELGELAAAFNEMTATLESRTNHLERLSFRDSLTGVYNRAYANRQIPALNAEGSDVFSVIMVDVNNLKLTNDTYGHAAGDRLLAGVAAVLQASCRRGDTVARWGGDEFVIILPGANETTAETVVARICKGLASAPADPIPLSVAVGYATRGDAIATFEEVFETAEANMYLDKQA